MYVHGLLHLCIWDEAESGRLLWGNFIDWRSQRNWESAILSYNVAFQFLEENMAGKMEKHLQKGQKN